jgi:hypothetical protein
MSEKTLRTNNISFRVLRPESGFSRHNRDPGVVRRSNDLVAIQKETFASIDQMRGRKPEPGNEEDFSETV